MQNPNRAVSELALVGEEIGLDLGRQMVNDYQNANPADVKSYIVGRQIVESILAQPGCVAIKFLNAYNEVGQKTLVYLGTNAEGKNILTYTVVTEKGTLESENGIVADRVKIPGTIKTSLDDADDWGWNID